MRTITLIASLGLLAAAEQPKTPAKLTTAEVIALTTIGQRLQELKRQSDELQKQQGEVVAEACTRAGIELAQCEIRPDGTIAKREEAVKK